MRKYFIAFILLCVLCISVCDAAIITIDTTIKHQTIMGYGSSSWYPSWISEKNKEDIIKEYVDVFGINRLRVEGLAGNKSDMRSWEWLNDNDDPNVTDWSKLSTKIFDERIAPTIMSYKNALEAKGEKLNIYVSPSFFDGGSTGSAPAWLEKNPAEYSEYALSLLIYLRDKCGIEADYYSILNEAGNNNRFTSKVVADMIKDLGPKLIAEGFNTKIQFPESINPQTSLRYLTETKNDTAMWKYIGLISYHLYGTHEPYRTQLRDSAFARGLPTAQTEYMSLTPTTLYEDMTNGSVSFWEIYGTGSCINFDYNSFTYKDNFWKFRQVTNYARPGFTRVEATSDNENVKVLAFKKNDEMVVVLFNTQAENVTINNIPNGNYGRSRMVNGKLPEEMGVVNITDNNISLQLVANSITTIYPKGEENLPSLITSWGSNPKFLKTPQSSVSLFATAIDPEKDNFSYGLEIISHPEGANVSYLPPEDPPYIPVTGMTEPGEYVFRISIWDGDNTVSKDIRVNVYEGNQPPVLLDVHNRIPVQIILPADTTVLRFSYWDLEGDVCTFLWSVLDQPEGSNIYIENPDTVPTKVRNFKLPGEYNFQIEIFDGTNFVRDTLNVPVYGEPNLVNDVHKNDGSYIYPNPADDYVEINVGANCNVTVQNEQIQIYNIYGECIFKSSLPSPLGEVQGLRLDVSNLPAGMYFVHIKNRMYKFLKL